MMTPRVTVRTWRGEDKVHAVDQALSRLTHKSEELGPKKWAYRLEARPERLHWRDASCQALFPKRGSQRNREHLISRFDKDIDFIRERGDLLPEFSAARVQLPRSIRNLGNQALQGRHKAFGAPEKPTRFLNQPRQADGIAAGQRSIDRKARVKARRK